MVLKYESIEYFKVQSWMTFDLSINISKMVIYDKFPVSGFPPFWLKQLKQTQVIWLVVQ